jgi:hypothetical protein
VFVIVGLMMITAEELAHSLHTSGKSLRSWLRQQYPNRESGAPWLFTASEAADLRTRWRSRGVARVVAFRPSVHDAPTNVPAATSNIPRSNGGLEHEHDQVALPFMDRGEAFTQQTHESERRSVGADAGGDLREPFSQGTVLRDKLGIDCSDVDHGVSSKVELSDSNGVTNKVGRHELHMFSAKWLRDDDFRGFQTWSALDLPQIPQCGGVYAVIRCSTAPPAFASVSRGGHFKGRNPTVTIPELQAKWVAGVETIYIGKANDLRKRLRQYRDFGAGRPVGHWGGRYIWQLADASQLHVCWKPTLGAPETTEFQMLRTFAQQHGTLPFANLRF